MSLASIIPPVRGDAHFFTSDPVERSRIEQLTLTDSNHRDTTSLDVRVEMLAKGYVSEGYRAGGVTKRVTPQ
jgi:hypothetical protein